MKFVIGERPDTFDTQEEVDLEVAIRLHGEVYVDGTLHTLVTAFDTDEGYIVKWKKDENGYVRQADGELVSETVFGKVEVFDQRSGARLA